MSSQTSVTVREVCGRGKGKIFQYNKKKPADTSVHVNAMIYFKFRLLLKFRNNAKLLSHNFKFPYSFPLTKYINVKLIFRKKNIIMGREPLVGVPSLVSCVTHLSSVSSTTLTSRFRNLFILDPFCSSCKNCGFTFQIAFVAEFTRPNSLNTSRIFSFFYLSCHHFPSMLKTFLLFVTAAMLSPYPFAVNCSCRKVQRNLPTN